MSDAARDLSILVRQHARSVQLMGVDFVPVSRGELTVPGPSVRPPAPAVEPKAFIPATVAPAAAPVARIAPPPAHAPDLLPGVTPAPFGPPRHPLVGTDPARTKAQELLDALQARYEADAPHEKFVTDHHCIVFGEGDPKAKLVFVGEAPGADEDKCGRPFVGRAGQLLDKMIIALGLKRQDVYICNVLKTRPPNNATPTQDEAALCAPYLYEQLMIVDPVCIVTLGLPASRTLLNTAESMTNLRGRWWQFQPPPALLAKGARPIPVMPTYHPAFLLRSYTRENRQKVWSDLQQAAAKIGHTIPAAARTGADAEG